MSILASIFVLATTVTPAYQSHNDVSGNQPTMTNIVEWAASIGGGGGGTDGAAVTNIVNSIFPSNRVFGVTGGLLTAYETKGGETNQIWQEARGYSITNGVEIKYGQTHVGWANPAVDGSIVTIALTDATASSGVYIDLPSAWDAEARDFCVYVFNGAGVASPLSLPPDVTIYGYSSSATNALAARTATALYFTEISRGTFLFGRAELTKVQEAAQ